MLGIASDHVMPVVRNEVEVSVEECMFDEFLDVVVQVSILYQKITYLLVELAFRIDINQHDLLDHGVQETKVLQIVNEFDVGQFRPCVRVCGDCKTQIYPRN